MKGLSQWNGWPVLKAVGWNLFLLSAGSVIAAVGINGILIPQRFVSGGVTGLSLIIHYLMPAFSVALIYAVINVPLFLSGWFLISRRFFFYSIAGTVIYSVAIAWVDFGVIPVKEQMLAAILAGIIIGTGSGIMLKSLGSSGGSDILSVILLQRFSLRLGTTGLAFNVLVLAAVAFLFSIEGALFTLIYLFVAAKVVDLVVTGLSQRKAIFIISPKWREISRGILEEVQRGATVLQGRGAYSQREHEILYTVVNFRELAVLKRIVQREDPTAFVVVSDTAEVMGRRIGNQPHWGEPTQ